MRHWMARGAVLGVLAALLCSPLFVAPLSAEPVAQDQAPPIESAEATATPTPRPVLSLPDLVDAVAPSVVQVIVQTTDGVFAGSGVKVSAGVLTNEHVVEGASEATVIAPSGEVVQLRVARRDVGYDLALLTGEETLPPLTLEPALAHRRGETVIALGYPRPGDLTRGQATLTQGLISAYRYLDGVLYVQTDAAVNPGSSGGALLNMRGGLIGLTTFGLRDSEGLNFAVASESIEEFLAGGVLIPEGQSPPSQATARPQTTPTPTITPTPAPRPTQGPPPSATPTLTILPYLLTAAEMGSGWVELSSSSFRGSSDPSNPNIPSYVASRSLRSPAGLTVYQYLNHAVSLDDYFRHVTTLSPEGRTREENSRGIAQNDPPWQEIAVAVPSGNKTLRQLDEKTGDLTLFMAIKRNDYLLRLYMVGKRGTASEPTVQFLSDTAVRIMNKVPDR